MNADPEMRTMEPLYQKAERLVKHCKGLQKRHELQGAMISRYRGDDFVDSVQVSLTEIRNRIRGYAYQGYEISFTVTAGILDVVVLGD